jgi:hypothetical protein
VLELVTYRAIVSIALILCFLGLMLQVWLGPGNLAATNTTTGLQCEDSTGATQLFSHLGAMLGLASLRCLSILSGLCADERMSPALPPVAATAAINLLFSDRLVPHLAGMTASGGVDGADHNDDPLI